MSNSRSTNNLKQVLEDQVSKDDLHDLLKKYKDNNKKEIRLTGNKTELIDDLIPLMNRGIINNIEVHDLIRESEEYGDQYIYFFRVRDQFLNQFLDDVETVKEKAFTKAKRTAKPDEFPRIKKIPKELEWADFRSPNNGVENSWMAKLYDKKTRQKKISDVKIGSKRTVIYNEISSRVIYIAEWDGNEMLQYRISRSQFDSEIGVNGSISKLDSVFKSTKAIDFKHLERWNLNKAVDYILRNYEKHKKEFKLLHTDLEDSQRGVAKISAFDEAGNLFNSSSRKKAIKAYLSGDGNGTGVVVVFLQSGSKSLLKKDIRVYIGRDEVNQVIINSKLSLEEYNYVRRKIEEFNSKVS